MRVWLYLALCAAGALSAACLLGLLASLVTGAPAYGAERSGCPVELERVPQTAFIVSPRDAADLARTIYMESRGESLCGQVAVAFVAINRMRANPDAWGRTVSDVVRKSRQFSPWNTRASRARMARLNERDPSYRLAAFAARLALSGAVADPTAGSTHFIAAGSRKPPWARRMTARRIGNHIFLKAR